LRDDGGTNTLRFIEQHARSRKNKTRCSSQLLDGPRAGPCSSDGVLKFLKCHREHLAKDAGVFYTTKGHLGTWTSSERHVLQGVSAL
jgi:hypothetical protein